MLQNRKSYADLAQKAYSPKKFKPFVIQPIPVKPLTSATHKIKISTPKPSNFRKRKHFQSISEKNDST